MSFGKKLSKIFRNVAANGLFIAASVPLSIGAGVLIEHQIDHPYAAQAAVTNVMMHEAAVQKVHGLESDILVQESKIEFNTKIMDKARENIGKGGAGLAADLATLQQGYAGIDKDKQTLAGELSAFQRELLVNPALSERDAHDLYREFRDAAYTRNMPDIMDHFAPFNGAIAYRDETKAALGVPADPDKVSPEQLSRVLEASRAGASGNRQRDGEGLSGGIGSVFGGLLGLSLLARRRKQREEEEENARKQAARPSPAAPPPPEKTVAVEPATKRPGASRLKL